MARRTRHNNGGRGPGFYCANLTFRSKVLPPNVAVEGAAYTKNWPARRPVRSHQRVISQEVARAKAQPWFLKTALSTSAEKQARRAKQIAALVA